MPRSPLILVAASATTTGILALGFVAFGFWTTVIFSSGFLGGLVLWLLNPATPSYAAIRVPFLATFALFVVHRVEEKVMGFFRALSELTHVQTPDTLSWQVVLLVVSSVGAWLAVPPLVTRGYAFGYYLAWTFFAAMGVTELAHFIFPVFAAGPYSYFPGMVSVVALAPTAWWGMRRLSHVAGGAI
jgi:hypothetical protein